MWQRFTLHQRRRTVKLLLTFTFLWLGSLFLVISQLEPATSDQYPALYMFRKASSSRDLDQPHSDSLRIWPADLEQSDRITQQMALTRRADRNITIFTAGFSGVKSGHQIFVNHQCPVKDCVITTDKRQRLSADVLIYSDSALAMDAPNLRSLHEDQVVVWYMLESPQNRAKLSKNIRVNWTASYRLDSVINTPYERFTPFPQSSLKSRDVTLNYARNKTKMAAWFVSNCASVNKRKDYVTELQEYISVDIYGGCGTFRCSRAQSDSCFTLLKNQYKFYLSFENSNCKDYITEKLYWNAYLNDIVPVVMGAPPEDYAKVAPPGSYIHVDDFESPRHLAEYLKVLDADDELYNQYFRWKGTGEFIDTKFWCRLCSLAHEAHRTGVRIWYNDVSKWWNGEEDNPVCILPGSQGWASWIISTKRFVSDPTNLHIVTDNK